MTKLIKGKLYSRVIGNRFTVFEFIDITDGEFYKVKIIYTNESHLKNRSQQVGYLVKGEGLIEETTRDEALVKAL